MPANGTGSGAGYAAFISYSHKDAGAARALHRRLEGYRIPKRLAGSEGAHGPVPERLTPIFRDREDLPAAGDLSETVRAALARSDNLVVLCSPAAAASPWVGREIEAFRALHPDRPVYAAIVAGEPPACFPPALMAGAAVEPLAADLRREGDGRRLGFLKLVAGLAGVGLDALVQRDAARRIRRVTAVTAGALVAVLAMAVLTIVALGARAEAERQRAEAEGLVEFMLTDLRDRLKGVGRLDVLGAVNQRALAYYGGQSNLDGLSDESLGRRARILHAIGDDNLARRRVDEALVAFAEAEETTRVQMTRSPNDAQRLIEHAKSDFGIGRVFELRDDSKRALHHYQASAAVTDRLLALDPTNPEHLKKAAAAAINIGNVHLRGLNDYAAAQRSYERAVALLGRAAAAQEGDVHTLLSQANAYGWLADTFFVRKLWQESLDARLRQHAIVERLQRAKPGDAEIAFRLAAAQRGVAHSLLRTGDRRGARKQLFAAWGLTSRLTRRDPANVEWRLVHGTLARDFLRVGLGVPPGTTIERLRSEEAASHHAASEAHPRNAH
jgi:tetratricopeptide (TPR) repeat protein